MYPGHVRRSTWKGSTTPYPFRLGTQAVQTYDLALSTLGFLFDSLLKLHTIEDIFFANISATLCTVRLLTASPLVCC